YVGKRNHKLHSFSRRRFLEFIEVTMERDSAKNAAEALLEFYKKLRPGDPQPLAVIPFFKYRPDINSLDCGRLDVALAIVEEAAAAALHAL
ncbi:MAG: hypothetical protein ACK2T3_14085, partial [Candidatus Promineifilaceae bacterium]